MDKIKINKAIIVEGKYDKIKLKSIIDGTIITLDGYKIYKDKEKQAVIKKLAETQGIILLTDSDTTGFRLRSYIKSFSNNGEIINIYIPQIKGKEKRKAVPSKEGTLGVEGIDSEILAELLKKYNCIDIKENNISNEPLITRDNFFDDGLMGGGNSKELRQKLSKQLGLPEYMTTNSLLDIINTLISYTEYKNIIEKIKE